MGQRGPYAKGRAKREEILAVALDVVARNGCRLASSREIARRVGLSQTGLMHYFGSREQLYQELLQARDERDRVTYYEPSPNIDGVLAVIAHNQDVPGLVQLYAEFSAEAGHPDHPSHGFFVERYDWLRGVLTKAFEDAQEEGALGPHIEIASAVDLLLAAADGLQIQWLLNPDVDMAGGLRTLWQTMCLSSHHPSG